jgi:hypothetical protein
MKASFVWTTNKHNVLKNPSDFIVRPNITNKGIVGTVNINTV